MREVYEEAVKNKQEKFIFHKMEFLTTYVKYLLDYAERLHMKEETYITLSTEMYKGFEVERKGCVKIGL